MSSCFFWFRRDLRLNDNAGLYHALKEYEKVYPVFIFDNNILDDLEDRQDARVTFIHRTICQLKIELREMGSDLIVRHGDPEEVWNTLIAEFKINEVYTNRDYEPYAMQRDETIKSNLVTSGGDLKDFKDHVIFEKVEVLKKDGLPYTVFTPYKRKWLAKLASKVEDGLSFYLKSYPTLQYRDSLAKFDAGNVPSLEEMNFTTSDIPIPEKEVKQSVIRNYNETRDFPALEHGTSKLGIHYRFGTISIREKARRAQALNQTYLDELIWRDFYSQIMANFPRVVNNAFRVKYDNIEWENNPKDFEKWKIGKTGYPMVDAGMRELNNTGHMHNRVRMIVASFLCKHLLIHWSWGENYFAQKLLDYDLASNNGGWQWASGSGTDAAPYFRIFNPESQQKKFDRNYEYIKKWVPEFGTQEYCPPMIDHKWARERCLRVYKEGLK